MRIFSILVSTVFVLSLTACGESSSSGSGKDPSGQAPSLGVTDLSKLIKVDLTEGTGDVAVPGKTISVHYIGTFENGTKFESSYDSGAPFNFKLGTGSVIIGWDAGIPGMKVGGKRRLTIPPALAYGSRGAGPIPPNTTIIFEVELLSVK